MPYILGLDLGQAADFSALAALEQQEEYGPPLPGRRMLNHYACSGLKRWPLGTPYPAVVEELQALLRRPGLAGCTLVVDGTGVGRPVVDMIRRAKLPCQLRAAVITAGAGQSFADGYFHVAKQLLVSTTQVLLQQRRLRFARGLPETPVLVRELEAYRVKVTAAANETFDARQGEHDDLVLAVALACWFGERGLKRLRVWGGEPRPGDADPRWRHWP